MAVAYKKDEYGVNKIIRTGSDLIEYNRLKLNKKISECKKFLIDDKKTKNILVDNISNYVIDIEILKLKIDKIKLNMRPIESQLEEIEKSILENENFIEENPVYIFDKKEIK